MARRGWYARCKDLAYFVTSYTVSNWHARRRVSRRRGRATIIWETSSPVLYFIIEVVDDDSCGGRRRRRGGHPSRWKWRGEKEKNRRTFDLLNHRPEKYLLSFISRWIWSRNQSFRTIICENILTKILWMRTRLGNRTKSKSRWIWSRNESSSLGQYFNENILDENAA